MAAFANMLSNKMSLQTLGLEYNRVRSRGANHIFEVIKALPNFERLFFSHNLIADASGEPIKQLLAMS